MTLLGLILIGLLTLVYSYYSKQPIEKNDLMLIKGELQNKPKLITWGGDMPYYEIELILKDKRKDFSLINCGYDLINEEHILSLKTGQEVQLYVSRLEYRNDDDVEIFSLTIGKENVFKIDEYNRCYVNYWKRLYPLVIIMLIILIFRIFHGLGFTEKIKKLYK